MSQLPEFVQLMDKINYIFNETSLYNLSDAKIESLFSAARQLEIQILLMRKETPKTLDALNSQLHQVESENFPIYSFNDFEMACDRLMIVFLTNTKHVNDIALTKAVQHYISIFSVSRYEKLYFKLVAQCAMSNVALSIMNDCAENCTNLDTYNAKIYHELPILLDQGRRGFPAATKLIHSLMFDDDTSLEALLKALLMYEENSIVLVFVHGTIIKILQKVDNDYVKFWRLLGKVKDQTLLPKLADKFPDFLSCLEKFIISSGDGLKITTTEDSKVHVDWVDSLITHQELVSLIKTMVNSGCLSGTVIKEAIIEKQQRALRSGEINQHYGWLELTKECLTFHK